MEILLTFNIFAASEEFIDERIGMLINKDSPYLPVINQE